MFIRKFLFLFFIVYSISANASTHRFVLKENDFTHINNVIQKTLDENKVSFSVKNDNILDIYFDLPELSYLKNGGYIRYRAVAYLSKKKKKRKYRESIFYSLNGKTTTSYAVKHYNNVKTLEGKHPLLSLIKRKEREAFINKLKQDGVKYPMRLKKILEVAKIVNTYVLKNSAKITISSDKASALENSTQYIVVILNIDNIILLNKIENALYKKEIIQNEYAGAYKQMKKNIFLFNIIMEYPYLVNLLYSLGFGIIGILMIVGLFWKRLFGKGENK